MERFILDALSYNSEQLLSAAARSSQMRPAGRGALALETDGLPSASVAAMGVEGLGADGEAYIETLKAEKEILKRRLVAAEAQAAQETARAEEAIAALAAERARPWWRRLVG
jgi:hypothetical protein